MRSLTPFAIIAILYMASATNAAPISIEHHVSFIEKALQPRSIRPQETELTANKAGTEPTHRLVGGEPVRLAIPADKRWEPEVINGRYTRAHWK